MPYDIDDPRLDDLYPLAQATKAYNAVLTGPTEAEVVDSYLQLLPKVEPIEEHPEIYLG